MKRLLQNTSSKFPNAIAVLSDKSCTTYRELNLWANSLAPEISKRKQNCIPLETGPAASDVIILWALWRAGKTAVLINTRLPKAVIAKQLKFLSSTRLNSAATILFTSGSSALPKAVVHTHANHYYNALGSQANIPLKVNDRWLLSLPLYHVSGLSIVYRCCLAGATVVVPAKNKTLIQNIKDYKITHLSLVPTQLFRFLKEKKNIPILRRLKSILIGGGPIPAELIKTALKHKLPIYLTYGLTETASQVATSSAEDLKARKVFAVRALPYRQIKFASDGEILVKGKILSPGYLTSNGIKKIADEREWFATGDIGKKISVDQFIVLGRKDNMFISGGENIYPEEIEQYLMGHPAIQQAVVIPKSDREFGMRPVVFCKFHAGTKVSKNVLRKFLMQSLPGYKIPIGFYKIIERKGDAAGDFKLNRRALRAQI